MHQAAMQSSGVEGTYVIRDLAPSEIDAFVAELREGRYTGCNVTTPYKAVMAARCDYLDGDAESLGVVNTITVRGGRLLGVTTDADGFELALSEDSMWPRQGATALVLGAGGAAAAVALALTRVPLLRLRIAARRDAAAADLVEAPARIRRHRHRRRGIVTPSRRAKALGDRGQCDAGRTGLAAVRPAIGASAACSVVDLRYRPRPVDVVAAAIEIGPSRERRAGDASAAGTVELRDLDR